VAANTKNDSCAGGVTTTTTTATTDDVSNAVLAVDAHDEREALRVVLAAVSALLRFERDVELPIHGIDLALDAGVVATCRTCHLSWRVSRRRFSALSWWSCPAGCRRPSSGTHAATLNRPQG
jgi:hypothetical protein